MGAPSPETQRQLAPGTMLDDKYRIDRLLAVGGMGAVYVGTHVKLRKRVAIKLLKRELSSGPMLERFHREAIAASQIGHEGIAQVTDLGSTSEHEPFLVMEFLEGESLASRLKSTGPMAAEVAAELACEILSPLAAAHAAGIVHRDLKPDNVFLVRQSRAEAVKLLDFGISRMSDASEDFRLTTTGLVLGTPHYMSPEQARGDTGIGPAADVYAVGVILYELLTGQVPYIADNYNQLMYRVMLGDFPRPRTMRPELPVELEQVMCRAMALSPRMRYPSAIALERELLGFCRPAYRDATLARLAALPAVVHDVATSSGAMPLGGPSERWSDPSAMAATVTPAGLERPTPARATANQRPSKLGSIATRLEPTHQVRRRRVLPALAIITAVALATGGGLLAMQAASDEGASASATPEPSAPPTPEPAASAGAPAAGPTLVAAPAPTAAPAPVPVTEAAPTPIRLTFAIEPRGARVELDGRPLIGSELEVAPDAATHTLHIEAPGYQAREELVRFDMSQHIVLGLTRVGRSPRPKPARAKPSRDGARPVKRLESESPYQ